METPSTAGIYAIVNTGNGKRYIGSAVCFKERWKKHRTYLRGNRHHCAHLQAAWNQSGESVFSFEVLEVVAELVQLLEREQFWIDQERPEYNHCPVAGSRLGCRQSPETIAKVVAANKGFRHTEASKALVSAANKGKVRTPEARAKVSAARKAESEETRRKRSETLKGRALSEEHRAAIALGMKASGHKPPPCEFTPETRAKISASLQGNQRAKGNKFSDEARAQMSAARMGNQRNLGNKASEETRAKMSAMRKGVPKSPEHAEKLRAHMVAMNKARAGVKKGGAA